MEQERGIVDAQGRHRGAGAPLLKHCAACKAVGDGATQGYTRLPYSESQDGSAPDGIHPDACCLRRLLFLEPDFQAAFQTNAVKVGGTVALCYMQVTPIPWYNLPNRIGLESRLEVCW